MRLDAANGKDRELFVDRISGPRELQRADEEHRRGEQRDPDLPASRDGDALVRVDVLDRVQQPTPSFIGRWNALRPEIRPMPPARLLITDVLTASLRSLSPADAPPELIRPARPM